MAQLNLPHWKMTEREAGLFAAYWGAVLEKVEGSAEVVHQKVPPQDEMPG